MMVHLTQPSAIVMRTLVLARVLLASCVAGPTRTGEISPWEPPDDMNPDEFIAYLVIYGARRSYVRRLTDKGNS